MIGCENAPFYTGVERGEMRVGVEESGLSLFSFRGRFLLIARLQAVSRSYRAYMQRVIGLLRRLEGTFV